MRRTSGGTPPNAGAIRQVWKDRLRRPHGAPGLGDRRNHSALIDDRQSVLAQRRMIRATLEAAQPGWLLGARGCRFCVAHELGFCLGELQGRRIDYGLGLPVAQQRRDSEVPKLGGDPWGLVMFAVVDRNVAMAVTHKPPSAVDPDLCGQHALGVGSGSALVSSRPTRELRRELWEPGSGSSHWMRSRSSLSR